MNTECVQGDAIERCSYCLVCLYPPPALTFTSGGKIEKEVCRSSKAGLRSCRWESGTRTDSEISGSTWVGPCKDMLRECSWASISQTIFWMHWKLLTLTQTYHKLVPCDHTNLGNTVNVSLFAGYHVNEHIKDAEKFWSQRTVSLYLIQHFPYRLQCSMIIDSLWNTVLQNLIWGMYLKRELGRHLT